MSKRLSLGVRNIFSTHVNNKGLISIIHKMFYKSKQRRQATYNIDKKIEDYILNIYI